MPETKAGINYWWTFQKEWNDWRISISDRWPWVHIRTTRLNITRKREYLFLRLRRQKQGKDDLDRSHNGSQTEDKTEIFRPRTDARKNRRRRDIT